MKHATVKRKSKFPWVPVAIGAGVLLFASGALAGGGHHGGGAPPAPPPGGGGGGSVPVPTPDASWFSGFVNTMQTGSAGDLMLRDAPTTAGNVIERLPHGSSIKYADGQDVNGFSPVQAPDGKVGWAATQYLSS